MPAGDLVEKTSDSAFMVLCGDCSSLSKIRPAITSFLESGAYIADTAFANAKPAGSDAYKYAFARFSVDAEGYSVTAAVEFACMKSPVGPSRPIVYVMGAAVS